MMMSGEWGCGRDVKNMVVVWIVSVQVTLLVVMLGLGRMDWVWC